jgi:coatomer subunit delta
VQGDYQIDKQRKLLYWNLPLIDSSNSSGVLEFNVSTDDAGGFFPIAVNFMSSMTVNDIKVTQCSLVDGGTAPFSVEGSLVTDVYQVV